MVELKRKWISGRLYEVRLQWKNRKDDEIHMNKNNINE